MNGKNHICFNMIADPNWHAGNIYILNCIDALDALPKEERNKLFISVAVRNQNDFPIEFKHKVDAVFQDTLIHLIGYKILRMLPHFFRSKLFNFRKIDFYYPAGNLPRKWIFKWGGWIPDFQDKHLPHLFSEADLAARDKRNIHLASQSPVLAFSSEDAMQDYHRFYPQFTGNEFLLHFVSKVNPEWLNNPTTDTLQKFKIPERYVMVCNQFWKHKDHGTLIRALGILKRKGIILHAVCSGSTKDFRNPDYFPSLLKLIEEEQITDQFIVTGFISREDQIQLIRGSLAIVQPSLFEGWSTVVEDGRSLGKRVFLSDIGVHIEQNPPGAIFFKQQNAEDLALQIEREINSLQPGPDIEAEKLAYNNNQKMMVEFGKQLIAFSKA